MHAVSPGIMTLAFPLKPAVQVQCMGSCAIEYLQQCQVSMYVIRLFYTLCMYHCLLQNPNRIRIRITWFTSGANSRRAYIAQNVASKNLVVPLHEQQYTTSR